MLKRQRYSRPYSNFNNSRYSFNNIGSSIKPASFVTSINKQVPVAELDRPPSKTIFNDNKKGSGNCLKCGERFYLGHQCKKQQVIALQAKEENMGDNEAYWEDELEWEEDFGKVEISMHALDSREGG